MGRLVDVDDAPLEAAAVFDPLPWPLLLPPPLPLPPAAVVVVLPWACICFRRAALTASALCALALAFSAAISAGTLVPVFEPSTRLELAAAAARFSIT